MRERSTWSIDHSRRTRHSQVPLAIVIDHVNKLRYVTLHPADRVNTQRLAEKQLNPMQIVHVQIH